MNVMNDYENKLIQLDQSFSLGIKSLTVHPLAVNEERLYLDNVY